MSPPQVSFGVEGAPDGELNRSPAAAAVGRMASRSGLLLCHFEHRVELELPYWWVPEGRDDLGAPPDWRGGVLPESKYHSFRHDRMTGSFHPGHRAKWTAHELCHGLVGFAWRPDASSFFHALAARLAEALPVALWYFLDEEGLRRCDRHAGGGPLYQTYCAACEEAASRGPSPSQSSDGAWTERGLAFLETEITSVLDSSTQQTPLRHRLATLDLMSDGLAYASANVERLRSEEFASFVERFFPTTGVRVDSLEALAHRTRTVAAALTGGPMPDPTPSSDRWHWIAQDLAWRLLQVRAECDDECAQAIEAVVDSLADAPSKAGLTHACEAVEALVARYELPDADDLLALGCALPGGRGRSARQVTAGIRSALPRTAEALGPALAEVVVAFTDQDTAPQRSPLGRRFAAWLRAEAEDDALADLARFEAAVTHAAPADEVVTTLSRDPRAPLSPLLVAPDVEILHFDGPLPDAVRALVDGDDVEAAHPDDTTCVAIRRTPEGDVGVIGLQPHVGAALRAADGPTDPDVLGLSEEDIAALYAHCVLIPTSRVC